MAKQEEINKLSKIEKFKRFKIDGENLTSLLIEKTSVNGTSQGILDLVGMGGNLLNLWCNQNDQTPLLD